MIQIRHIGLYVKDLKKMTTFYRNVFNLHEIVSEYEQSGALIEDILGYEEGEVKITKLITEYGKSSGCGDMIELVEVISHYRCENDYKQKEIYQQGVSHICFSVEDMTDVIKKIEIYGGRLKTKIHYFKRNACCFALDPEGNYIEIIGIL